jgi:GC-rich sequence DNA-binding factor
VAKERRERLRATGASGEDDFISLSVTRRGEEPQGPHPDSRLVREEDELGEGDDGDYLVSWFISLQLSDSYP